jgi:DNA repair protein RAD7
VKLVQLLQQSPHLTSLDLSDSTTAGAELVKMLSKRLVCPSLVSLTLDGCSALFNQPDALMPLQAIKAPPLTRLSLSGLGTAVSDDFLLSMIGVGGGGSASSSASGATTTTTTATTPAFGGDLRTLVLNGATALTDASVGPLLRKCHGLHRLSLDDVIMLTDLAFTAADGEEITIGAASSSSSNAPLPPLPPQLQEVSLARCRKLTDASIFAIVHAAAGDGCGRNSGLKKLAVNGLAITDASLVALARCATAQQNLASLDVSFVRTITDGGLGFLADNCCELRTLTCWGCTQITDVFLKGHQSTTVKVVGTPTLMV